MNVCRSIFFVGLAVFFLSRVAIGAIDPSIVLYFTFDENEGDKVSDISGNGNDGSIHEAKWVNGKYKHALEFSGTGEYVEVLSNANLDIVDGITMMAWVYKPEFLPANNGETIFSRKDSGSYCFEVSGWENATPEKLDTEMQISGTYHRVASPDPLPLNRWVHTAVTYDGDAIRLYIDGEQVAEEQWPGQISNNPSNNLYVGIESDGTIPDATHGSFIGIIDEVILANRAFSVDEIQEYMRGATAVEPAKEKLSTCWGDIKAEF